MSIRAYSRFLSADPDRLHFAAHSHHYWPDCTREAQLQYWDDSARLVDQKWEHVFGGALHEARGHIARLLGVRSGDSIALAPNTHEFVARIFSCFEARPTRVLSTDSEFHSFSRQCRRLEEAGDIQVFRVPVAPRESFVERFIQASSKFSPDLIFASHVFFNSGWVLPDLEKTIIQLIGHAPQSTIVIDGYHAFCAIPIDLGSIQDKVFYLAGGYKYAQAGEGACFLHVPKSFNLTPKNTGWWADFAHLDSNQIGPIQYGSGGDRFAGSTFDPSGWYRFNAVMRWWLADSITPTSVHAHVRALQEQLIKGISRQPGVLTSSELALKPDEGVGHFLSFRSADAAQKCRTLAARKVITDSRSDILRVGIGLYHDATSINELIRRNSQREFN